MNNQKIGDTKSGIMNDEVSSESAVAVVAAAFVSKNLLPDFSKEKPFLIICSCVCCTRSPVLQSNNASLFHGIFIKTPVRQMDGRGGGSILTHCFVVREAEADHRLRRHVVPDASTTFSCCSIHRLLILRI